MRPRSSEIAVRGAFVGRERELAEVVAALDAASAGRGCLFCVTGEPGIGKTRLADEIAALAVARGGQAVWGRCWDASGTPAYWPWTQIFRSLAPGTADPFGAAGPEVPVPGSARFRLFQDAVDALIGATDGRAPLVVVLDDAHDADEDSLAFAHVLARQLRDASLALVVTYRDAQARLRPGVTARLAELAREGRSLPLRGLSEDQARRLVEGVAGRPVPDEISRDVHRATGGNPLFVDEVARVLAAGGGLDGRGAAITIPDTVREAIRRRLEPVSPTVGRVLRAAAVAGRFDHPLLARVEGLTAAGVAEALSEAALIGLVDRPSIDEPPRFAHPLIRETLYDGLGVADRRNLHRRVAEAIESAWAGRLDAGPLAELAHHHVRAGADDRAFDFSVQAAGQALRQLAYEDAARLYAQAADVLPEGADERPRCEVLLGLARAQWGSGELPAARTTFLDAARLARGAGLADLLAAAALGVGGRLTLGEAGRVDAELVEVLQAALDAVGPQDHAVRARLLARLAWELYFDPDPSRRLDAGRLAVEEARRAGDDATLAYALNAERFAAWGPGDPAERLALSSEMVTRAGRSGDPELVLQGHLWRVVDLLELGRVDEAASAVRAFTSIAESLRQPFYRWWAGTLAATMAFLEGRLDDSEALSVGAFSLAQEVGAADAPTYFAIQQVALWWIRGVMSEVEPMLAEYAHLYRDVPAFGACMVFLYAQIGRFDEARRCLDEVSGDDFAGIPEDALRVVALAAVADACRKVGTQAQRQRIYDLLLPHANRFIVVAFAVGCMGPVSRCLGLVAASLGRLAEAERHFAEAIAASRRAGMQPWLTLAQVECAEALVELGGDERRAATLAHEALQGATRHGFTALAARAGRVLEELAAPVAIAAQGGVSTNVVALRGGEGQAESVFALDGDVRLVAYGGAATRLRDGKGLRYLARLLASPGREFHVLDLAAAEAGGHPEKSASLPVLDTTAKHDYRSRLEDLRDELREARLWSDGEREARARLEMDAIAQQLASAVGLHGRDRRASDATERARKAVGKCVRDSLARLREAHPALARHLATALRLGTYCSYDPEIPVRWRV